METVEKGAKESLTEKVIHGLRLEGGRIHVGIWGKSIPGRGSSQCKGPEVGACMER